MKKILLFSFVLLAQGAVFCMEKVTPSKVKPSIEVKSPVVILGGEADINIFIQQNIAMAGSQKKEVSKIDEMFSVIITKQHKKEEKKVTLKKKATGLSKEEIEKHLLAIRNEKILKLFDEEDENK